MESTSNQQQLTLHIPKVTSDLNNTEYTCVVNILLLPQEIEISVNKSFILKVTDRIESSKNCFITIVVVVVIINIIIIIILLLLVSKRSE